MTRLKDHYDWIVLGDSPGALLSAGLVARLGLSVLVLPFVPGARLYVSQDGEYLDPEPNLILGLGKIDHFKTLLFECLAKMSILPSELAKIRKEDVLSQVLTPKMRALLTQDDEALGRELDREFGNGAGRAFGLTGALQRADSPILSFWKNYPERLTLSQIKTRRSQDPRTYEDVRRRLERSSRAVGTRTERAWFQKRKRAQRFSRDLGNADFNDFCKGMCHAISGSEIKNIVLPDLLHLVVLGRTVASFQGGLTAYREFLLNLARRLGAHVSDEADCRRLFIEDGRFVGAQVAHRGSVIGARGGILGCSLAHAKESVSVSGRRWFHRLKNAPRAAGWRFTIALTVHAEAIPPGMQTRSVWQEVGAPALSIELADSNDYGSTEPGHRWIFLRTILPFSAESLTANYQQMIAARMLRQLAELMPFLEYHMVRIFPDFRSGDGELKQVYPYESLDQIPENLRSISGTGVGAHSGVEGLFVATGESFPHLGNFGGTVAALEATAWVAHRCGLNGPFA